VTAAVTRTDVTVIAGDGTSLAGDLYLPAEPAGPFPAVVVRTPYGKANLIEEGTFWACQGRACLIQDVRGRHESDGRWEPYAHEHDDGAHVASWLTHCNWWDGRIVASGSSYAAFCAWALTEVAPQAVRGVISRVPATGLRDVKFDPSGVLNLAEHVAWWLTYGDCRTSRPRLARLQIDREPDLLATLPVTGIVRRLWADLPGWERAFRHPVDDTARPVVPGSIDVPALHVAGWHDALLPVSLAHWRAMPRSRLIVGPWSHLLTSTGQRYGDRDYGPRASPPLGRWEARWIREVLDGDSATDPRGARAFVMGLDRWFEFVRCHFEPAQNEHAVVTFHATQHHRLALEPCTAEAAHRFSYDPNDPYPSRPRPDDRRDLDERRDAVRYTSGPLTEALTVLGTPMALVRFGTDAAETDLVARLLEVTVDGAVLPISRGCHVVTGPIITPRPLRVAMRPTATHIPAGSRVRLEITSSDFPELARSLNTGQDRYRSDRVQTARQQVMPCGTRLDLPVADLRDNPEAEWT
jgi:putative CocE/NonD family hydrolase